MLVNVGNDLISGRFHFFLVILPETKFFKGRGLILSQSTHFCSYLFFNIFFFIFHLFYGTATRAEDIAGDIGVQGMFDYAVENYQNL